MSSQPDLRVLVISGSVRDERMGPAVLEWVCRELAPVPGLALDAVDLADVALPDARGLVPGGRPGATPLAARIDAAEAFVFCFPEYNRGVPASLKHAVDWHFREWMFKPAALVSYGVVGGLVAAEQLRQVLGELHVVTVRRGVGLARPWTRLADDGLRLPEDDAEGLRAAALQLRWWGRALRVARAAEPVPS
jgi:NAD(P)H-dependent FMN reductase